MPTGTPNTTPSAVVATPGASHPNLGSPFASAIAALYRLVDEPSEMEAFLREVAALEAIDARFLVPELLGIASQLAYRRADLDQADSLARRALDIAGTVDKPNEAARAYAILACVAAARSDADGFAAHSQAARERAPCCRSTWKTCSAKQRFSPTLETEARRQQWP